MNSCKPNSVRLLNSSRSSRRSPTRPPSRLKSPGGLPSSRIAWSIPGSKSLVLGISGGVDSLTAGLLAQRAMRELRTRTGDNSYKFIAVRLPYETQFDEHDAQASVDFIAPDERHTVNIGPAVKALASEVAAFEGKHAVSVDFVLGNTKARMRMVAQYTIAGAAHGLVIGTDHAAEAVMGFFTKFGDGACDLAPLSGLVKNQVRDIARSFGAPESLVEKSRRPTLKTCRPGSRMKRPTA